MKKVGIFLLAFLILSTIISKNALIAKAQVQVYGGPVTTVEGASVPTTVQTVKQSIWQTLVKILQKAGSIAFQRTLSTALNTIAYDAANYIGSGGSGQEPLFVKKNLGDYLTQIGDEAAGNFVESFVNNLNSTGTTDCNAGFDSCENSCAKNYPNLDSQRSSCDQSCFDKAAKCKSNNTSITQSAIEATPSFNVCQPSSLEAKLRIGLGLVEHNRPSAPNCTASQMIANWGTDIKEKIKDLQDPNFLDNFATIFDPASNDIGIYLMARTDLSSKAIIDTKNTENSYIANNGWLNKTDIAGNLVGAPGQAQRQLEEAQALQNAQFGKVTGDILIDAANVFLNQLGISVFNNLISNLGSKTSNNKSANNTLGNNYNNDPNLAYSSAAVKEITSTILQPKFSTQADYDVLASLSVCLDPNNPGPDNCVIDTKFMQAISEKKTVADAIKEGLLRGEWQLTADNRADSYASSYSLRNISILRKYRILPVGWELAAEKTNSDPSNPKKVTLMDMVSCFDPNDSYNQFSSDFNTRDQGWCQGLVDPNWVLKAPLNYCKKEGVGAQILNKTIVPGAKGQGSEADTLGQLNVVRADDYCADSQTCIKEKGDGSCEAYGYCNEEKRIWNFGNDSCQPIYNTCQAFTNTNNGQAVSYLANTLTYTGCNPESAGCRQYSLTGAYNATVDDVSWDKSQSLYLNKNLGSCNNTDEGCTELLRVKPTWGSNLVMDTNLDNDNIGASTSGNKLNDWPLTISPVATSHTVSIVDATQSPLNSSGKAIKLEANGPANLDNSIAVSSNHDNSLLPANLQVIPGISYTLSADVYLVDGDTAGVSIGTDAKAYKLTNVKNSWQHVTVTRAASDTFNDPNFTVGGYNSTNGRITLYIQNVKFEMSDYDTGYSNYGSFRVYEKLLPLYLEKSCYNSVTGATKDYSFKSDAPAVCSNYARKCNKEEVGCESYTSGKDNFSVPAKVTDTDYCPAECLGYDVYISKGSYFNSPAAENLIPKTATACTAAAAGCSEFTNLDTLNQGGEQKEYYTSLKQCIKPDTAQCGNFYAWEGTEGGYQLQSYSLKKDSNGLPYATEDDSSLCNSDIYNLPVSDPRFNPDCRQFYNTAGTASYHLVSRTVTCSDNCHAYRLSEKNVDKTITDSSSCSGSDKHWDANSNSCIVCLNGGVWDNNNGACIYQAIPGEGQTCSASENGCREYNGNGGNNVRLAGYYDFEGGFGNWGSTCNGGLSISTISNTKNGHSLQYNNSAMSSCDDAGAQLKVNGLVNQGAAYSAKFLVRAANTISLQIYFLDKDTRAKSCFNGQDKSGNCLPLTIKGGNAWNIYQANLATLDHSVGGSENLVIIGSGDFYLDNFIFSEITDRYYLIKNSSQIPNVCYYDISNNYQGADYNLGCTEYSDRDNLKHNLHKFTQICSDSAVGCEQMISTNNYAPYGQGIWNDTNNNGVCDSNEPDCVTVPGDTALYAVFDQSKQCNSSDMGCSRLGQAQGISTIISWTDVYKKNNPNQYSQSLCSQANVGCEEWKNDDNGSLSYFKDPGADVCIYRASKDTTIAGKAWYKIPVKRCDLNNDGEIKDVGGQAKETGTTVCTSDADCGGKHCIIDNTDYPCSFSYFKTIGLGGSGNQVPVPDKQAGLCEAASSGCTEYIDPVSKFAANLVYNPNFLKTGDTNNNGTCDSGETQCKNKYDGWGSSNGDKWNGSPVATTSQIISLEQNKLYSFNAIAKNGQFGNANLSFMTNIKPLLVDNTLGAVATNLQIAVGSSTRPVIFDSLNNKAALLSGGDPNFTFEIKQLAIGYQLQGNIDKKSCNGAVNFDNGCVLFNERGVNGASGIASLANGWDAYKSSDGSTPVQCNSNISGSCSANQLIKVQPDRVCSKWLDCTTYGLDSSGNKVCYAVGECDQLNDKNECGNIVKTTSTEYTHSFSAASDKNSTGYALLDKYYLGNMKEVGVNTDAHFDFESGDISISCQTPTGGNCLFEENLNSDLLVLAPDSAPTDYPAHGKGYLKVPGNYWISPLSASDFTRIYAGQDYYINYLINTKNSGANVKLLIYSNTGSGGAFVPLISFVDSAGSGWTRVVHKFNILGSGEKHIKIYMTSDSGEEKNVYFDDINIEPVLKIGDNLKPDGTDDEAKNYVAKDCRLYPESSSLSCESSNSNVIENGLYGYCLQYDALNPNVCNLWYPIDAISSINTGNKNGLGYKGKFPLYYCTEANGNFQLVKKIRMTWIGGSLSNKTTSGYPSQHVCKSKCWADEPDHDFYYYLNAADTKTYCGDSDNYDLVDLVRACDNYYNNYFCVPKTASVKIEGTRMTFKDYQKINSDFHDDTSCSDDIRFFQDAWVPYNGLVAKSKLSGQNADAINEGDNFSPPVAIYENDQDESTLKFITNADSSKVFRISCNRFAQLVDSSGNNKAWADRVSRNSIFPENTASFFGSPYSTQLSFYGRNREDIPFGAAILPSNFSLTSQKDLINLRDQYSNKNGENTLAGRPFGCSASSVYPFYSSGCSNIGQCSGNHSVYCVYDDVADSASKAIYDVNSKGCAGGGYGVCEKLWTAPLTTTASKSDSNGVLKNLFLNQYSQYQYSNASSNSGYKANSDDAFDWTNAIPGNCPSNIRSGDTFCSVYPEIFNVKFNAPASLNGNTVNILSGGIYSLVFNTKVDKEQQPLKQIVIDWGDGNIQVITGEDSRPLASQPHTFYHYYLEGSYQIQVKIFDNWGTYGCFSSHCTL